MRGRDVCYTVHSAQRERNLETFTRASGQTRAHTRAVEQMNKLARAHTHIFYFILFYLTKTLTMLHLDMYNLFLPMNM